MDQWPIGSTTEQGTSISYTLTISTRSESDLTNMYIPNSSFSRWMGCCGSELVTLGTDLLGLLLTHPVSCGGPLSMTRFANFIGWVFCQTANEIDRTMNSTESAERMVCREFEPGMSFVQSRAASGARQQATENPFWWHHDN